MPKSPDFATYHYDPILYNASSIRGVDIEPRPYDITQEILSRIPENGTLVDVGCGSAKKLPPLSPHIKNIIAVDYNKNVITEAYRTINGKNITNINIICCNGDALPIRNNSIDMVSYMLSPHNAIEAHRILKPNG